MEGDWDVIVVGSGASAVHACCPLVEAGLRVQMLDVGRRDHKYTQLIPDQGFLDIRHRDPGQHRYFLGDEFEGIPFRGIGAAAQLTPPRKHVIEHTDRLRPVEADGFSAVQSLALGGLGAAWGAVTVPFDRTDLAAWPIGCADLQPHYDAVARRIGIAGADDDLVRCLGTARVPLLPPALLDSNAQAALNRYLKKRAGLNRAGFFMGRARLAMATVRFRGRGPVEYHDMEFWADHNRAVYRPQFTVDELRKHQNFRYRSEMLVQAFRRRPDGDLEVSARNLSSTAQERFTARRLVLGAGTLGTARIVLRSLQRYRHRLPLVCNPYVYIACLNTAAIGKPVQDARHSLCQLIAYVQVGDQFLQAQLYSYRSLLTFRLVKELPLAYPEGIRLIRRLQPYLATINVYHSDRPGPDKYVELHRDQAADSDRLHIHYRIPADTEREHRAQQRRVMKLFLRLGCLPLKVVRPVHGASIHYGGCLPMTDEDRPLTTRPTGELRDASGVFIADGAAFPDLPAKALTLTLMAHANRVGVHVSEELKRTRMQGIC